MFDFHQKRKLRSIVNSPFTQGVILVLTLLVGWSTYVRYDIAMEMSDRRIQAEQQVATLQTRKDQLEEQVEYLSNERGLEAEMRKQFDVALEGEQIVVIVEDEPKESEIQPLSTTTAKEEDAKWYQFWR
ncbi:septum formation initiator family protein [Candidatus Kaiserbacteria bacterium]|nr:septum formation initiator family protein [Candidatus Kaiserbacteria bacterium]USN92295.1 MAG: septum formation initiator family protein [Candidatus Nomurabacteria bacterium]